MLLQLVEPPGDVQHVAQVPRHGQRLKVKPVLKEWTVGGVVTCEGRLAAGRVIKSAPQLANRCRVVKMH